GWRPKYALLHTFSLGIPTYFDTMGPFLVATTAARVNPGYHIYAYSKGTLHMFGSFRSSADEAPNLQLGDQLFMKTWDHFRSFEITLSGEAYARLMTAGDIVSRNNTAIIIEDESRMSDEAKAEMKKEHTNNQWILFGDYGRSIALPYFTTGIHSISSEQEPAIPRIALRSCRLV